MIFVVLGLVIGVMAGWKIAGQKEDYLGHSWSIILVRFFFPCFFGIIGIGIGLGVASTVGEVLPTKYVITDQVELVALNDYGGIRGSFFLGTGTVETEFYYVFYKKEKNGSVKLDKLRANDKVSIIEEGRKDGVIEVYEKELMEGNIYHLFAASPRYQYKPPYGRIYKIRIPRGSIYRGFKLDLK